MELTVDMMVTILKGIALSITQMAKPSLKEINKMLEGFSMELIIKPQLYQYRKCPQKLGEYVFTWHVFGSDRGNYGILEWCHNKEDADKTLSQMQKFPQFTDLKIGNTDWDKKDESIYGKFTLTYVEAMSYIADNPKGKVTRNKGTNGIYYHCLFSKVLVRDYDGLIGELKPSELLENDTWCIVE